MNTNSSMKRIIPLLVWDLVVFIIAAVIILMSKKPIETFLDESPGFIILMMILFFAGTPVIFILIPATLGKAHKQYLLTSGVSATAKVLEVGETSFTVMGKHLKKIRLEVTPPAGQVYEATIEQGYTTSAPLPSVGDTVMVRFNSNAPDDVVIVQ